MSTAPVTPVLINSRCSIARSLEVLGEKWTLLIVRESMWGRTRFAEFRARLGIAPDVLSDRLGKLVDAGVLTRQAYREAGERERDEYVLTDAGRDLLPVLAALVAWGDVHRPSGYGPSSRLIESGDDEAAVHLAFVDDAGRVIEPSDVQLARGPGSPFLEASALAP